MKILFVTWALLCLCIAASPSVTAINTVDVVTGEYANTCFFAVVPNHASIELCAPKRIMFMAVVENAYVQINADGIKVGIVEILPDAQG
jgi:hypothetical protein